ncbi:Uncharacterised protein [Oligella urethralis]|uniref:Galectin domain-containing protein n=2 Tax=Alcaligenaceae TaxID=506 RepID=A0A2X1ULL9_9BURK|nr:hypothetical protein HMPREF3179_03630 [Oligella sp. HMSC09E12]SPY08039.1 Uncharacterised protein [Oligella urethralis]
MTIRNESSAHACHYKILLDKLQMSVKMTNNIFELLEQYETDKDVFKRIGLSKYAQASLIKHPETWQVYVNRRTQYAPAHRSDIAALDRWFAEHSGLSVHQVRSVTRAMKLQPKRPKKVTNREQDLVDYYTYRKKLAEHLYTLISGRKAVNEIVRETGLNERTVYRRMMAAVQEVRPQVETKYDLNNMTEAGRLALAEKVRANELDKWDEKKLALLSDAEKEEIWKKR